MKHCGVTKNMSSPMEKDPAAMESFNQRQQTKSLEDIMYQRMKNRERQRRYRERKRLLADMNRSVAMIEATPPPLALPPPPSSAIVPYQRVPRVRCTRDWKKDARRAHTAKQEGGDAPTQHNQYVTHGNKVSDYTSKNDISSNPSALENGEKSKIKSVRRDWKAEARNKKGQTS